MLVFIIFVLFTTSEAQIVQNSNNLSTTQISSKVKYFTTISSLNTSLTINDIFSQLAMPSYSYIHGYNLISLQSWTCAGGSDGPLNFWKQPTVVINDTFGLTDSQTIINLKQFYSFSQIQLTATLFGKLQNPVSQNINASQCGQKIRKFIQQTHLDGVNIDFRDRQSLKKGSAYAWLQEFIKQIKKSQINVYLTVNATLFDQKTYPNNTFINLQKKLKNVITSYIVRFQDQIQTFKTFDQIFYNNYSIFNLVKNGFQIKKIIPAKPSFNYSNNFVPPSTLITWSKQANSVFNWSVGWALSPYIWQLARQQMNIVTKRVDSIRPISAVYLDTVSNWWPPQKIASDIALPGLSGQNLYNTLIFGTWTCGYGVFDIVKLWKNASDYLGTVYGSDTPSIQSSLKKKYINSKKKILVKAFGIAQSPTTSKINATQCAMNLSIFVKSNNLDGVDVSYQDNVAFNNGLAQDWLIEFTEKLRSELPFHTISHSIQNYYIDSARYSGGGYQKVILSVGSKIDYYTIYYYGQNSNADYTTYQDIFTSFTTNSLIKLSSLGFQLAKIVIGKPITPSQSQSKGYVLPSKLRQFTLRAHREFGYRPGFCMSSYINDKNATFINTLLRNIDKSVPIRFAYVNNVKNWWPPNQTLAQIGVPSFASNNSYNYFAFSFWTYKRGPLSITKFFNDPVTYLGSEYGSNKTKIQQNIKGLYNSNNKKLLLSLFGDTQFPINQTIDPIDCANKVVQFFTNNSYDGIDVDFQDSAGFQKGLAEEWLIAFTKQIKYRLPMHILTHAPQAPYFSSNFSSKGGYHKINNQVGDMIDFYNIQFYNQGNTTYDNYTGLFVNSGLLNPSSSVFQILSSGLQPQKLVLGKPAAPKDAYNSGYVSSVILNQMLVRSQVDPLNRVGWKPNLMIWNFLSDLNGNFVRNITKGI